MPAPRPSSPNGSKPRSSTRASWSPARPPGKRSPATRSPDSGTAIKIRPGSASDDRGSLPPDSIANQAHRGDGEQGPCGRLGRRQDRAVQAEQVRVILAVELTAADDLADVVDADRGL